MTNLCKICGSREKNKLFELCSNLKLMGEHFPKTPCIMTECNNCGLVYIDTEATQEDFDKYYTSPNSNPFGYYEIYGEKNTDKYFQDILNKFESKITKDSKILDFAGGTGDFVQFLKKKGYKNSSMLEISAKCEEIAKTKGVDTILYNGVETLETETRKYDLIVMIHSLEHFKDIDKVILNAKKMLKNDGYLYIEVPDSEKYSNTESVPYTMFTYEHIYHFTKDTMRNIARAFGLSILDVGQFFKAESYDVLYALYQNGNSKSEVEYSTSVRDAVIKYKECSKERLKPFIEQFEKSSEKLILWGIGASTALLLNETFDNCNVLQLIDRNKNRQGLEYTIAGKAYSVQDPKDIKDNTATIVVLPYWYHDSIMKQIKEMGFKNPVKALM